jgi:hypothetical protein
MIEIAPLMLAPLSAVLSCCMYPIAAATLDKAPSINI